MPEDSVSGRSDVSLPLEAEHIVPHRKPIRLVDRLIECTEDAATAEATIEPENVLADEDGRVDRAVFIELMAQTYAACKGHLGIIQGEPVRKGFLVGVRSLSISGDLSVGDRAVIQVKKATVFGAFAVIDGIVLRDGLQLASANLKLWIPDQLPER
jgi:predicted hotdog family 3-hydroxylacyl-ACP dehydratase